MAKRMLIAVDEEESRVAIVHNSRLLNLEIESNASEGRRGNIYKGVVHKVEQSLQAAFIDFGEEKQGFLPLSEIHKRLWPSGITEKRPDITKLLKEKQELMVQVVKDEVGTKGATLTTYVSLPGRYLVLMPESDKHGISRRISESERRRLKETVDAIGVPDGFGVIIRTAGRQQRPLELKKDLLYLTKLYDHIEDSFGVRKAAGLIYRDRSHPVRFVRDYFHDDVDEVWVDHRSTLKEISDFMGVLMPTAQQKLRLYEGDVPMFIKFGVEDQIESVFARQVELPSGGSIVLDSTEALVAIDVNSGRVKGEDIEETALAANLDAADEIARQVIIRDLGGLLVVDFIDMRDRKHNRQVEQRLRQAFAQDKAKIKFGRISEFGLMELSRQRLRKSLFTTITRRCDSCDGTGHVRSPASAGLSLLRRIEEACLRGEVKYVRATAPVAIANLLHNRRRREMMEIEQKLDVVLEVVGHNDMPPNLVALDVVIMRGGRSGPQRVYQLLDLIRNEVIRRDTSPLPKPEAGLEALELDHTAIYRAIAERDAILKAQQAAVEEDFEFNPQEPDLAQDEAAALAAEAEALREREAEEVAAAKHVETVATETKTDEAGDKGTGFIGWMKRIFGGDEEPETTPEVNMQPITEEAVEQRQSSRGRRGRSRSRSRRRGGRGGGRGQGQGQAGNSRNKSGEAARSGGQAKADAASGDDDRKDRRRSRRSRSRTASKGSANGAASNDQSGAEKSAGSRQSASKSGGGNAKTAADGNSPPPTPKQSNRRSTRSAPKAGGESKAASGAAAKSSAKSSAASSAKPSGRRSSRSSGEGTADKPKAGASKDAPPKRLKAAKPDTGAKPPAAS